MPADLFKVTASFLNAEGLPLNGSEYSVSLLDKDHFFNDKLGTGALSNDGVAEFLFSVADIFSIDSPGERTPDIYFVLEKSGREIFRSEIFSEVNFDATDPVTGRPKGLTKAFGPFRIVE